jgi:hypothetical protein
LVTPFAMRPGICPTKPSGQCPPRRKSARSRS